VGEDFDGSNVAGASNTDTVPDVAQAIAQDEAQATDGLLAFSACDKGCGETIPT
jgi:hypothetical protein